MASPFEEKIPWQEVALGLFRFTVNDTSHQRLISAALTDPGPIFPPQHRDFSMAAILLPELLNYNREDIKVLRVELMWFTFATIDFHLMRASGVRENLGHKSEEILTAYVHEFNDKIAPSGRFREFLEAAEERLRAYNKAWDRAFSLDSGGGATLTEEFLTFCGARLDQLNPP